MSRGGGVDHLSQLIERKRSSGYFAPPRLHWCLPEVTIIHRRVPRNGNGRFEHICSVRSRLPHLATTGDPVYKEDLLIRSLSSLLNLPYPSVKKEPSTMRHSRSRKRWLDQLDRIGSSKFESILFIAVSQTPNGVAVTVQPDSALQGHPDNRMSSGTVSYVDLFTLLL